MAVGQQHPEPWQWLTMVVLVLVKFLTSAVLQGHGQGSVEMDKRIDEVRICAGHIAEVE